MLNKSEKPLLNPDKLRQRNSDSLYFHKRCVVINKRRIQKYGAQSIGHYQLRDNFMH
jgi:hypothetical protein